MANNVNTKPKNTNPFFKRKNKSRNRLNYSVDELLGKRLEEFENEGKSEAFFRRQTKYLNERLKEQKVTPKDIFYWKCFVEAVEEKKRNVPDGKCYFDMELLDKVPFPKKPKLIFYYGAKNIGKTYSQAIYFSKRLVENPKSQIMMIRTSREEISKGLLNQLQGEEWPFKLVLTSRTLKRKPGYLKERGEGETRSEKQGRKKKHSADAEITEIMDKPKNLKENADICGWATYATCTGFRSFQGSSWKNLTDIVWDEFNDTGDVRTGLTDDIFKNFLVFVLSLERNNKDLRIWLFGNLLRQDSGVASNIALKMFKVPYSCNLKYWEFANGTPAVYINLGQAGELFNSVEDQKFTDMFGAEMSRDLYTNMPEPYSSKVLSVSVFCKAEPFYSFIAEFEEKYYIIYIGKLSSPKDNDPSPYYILHLEGYTPYCYYPGYYPVTDSVEIFNQYGSLRFKKAKKIARQVKKIRKLQKKQRLFFSADDVRALFCTKLAKQLVIQYKKELDGDI